jgi:hypothetical protein
MSSGVGVPLGGGGIRQLTSDVLAGPGSGSQVATLATVNASPGTYTYATITVNAKGLVTLASSGTPPDLSSAVILAPASSARNVIQPTGDFKPLVVKRFNAGATSNLFEAQDENGNALLTVGKSGYLEVAEQSAPGTPTNAIRFFADASNRFSWKGENGFVRTFDGTANLADRVYVLPDVSGTVALTSDVTAATALAVILAPASSARNTIQPTGDFVALTLRSAGAESATTLEVTDKNSVRVFAANKNGVLLGSIFPTAADGTAAIQFKGFSDGFPYLIVDSTNGKLGLGPRGAAAVAPTARLDVYSDSASAGENVISNTLYNNSSAAVGLSLRKARGSHTSAQTVANSDFGGVVGFKIHDGTAFLNTTWFGVQVNGTVATGSVPQDFFIANGATDDGSIANKRLVISSAGLVGLSTAVLASTKLYVPTGADGNVGVVVRGNSASQSANLQEWQTSTPTTVASISSIGVATLKPIDAVTNAVTNVLTLAHTLTTANAGAAGIATGLVFQAADSTAAIGAGVTQADITASLVVATHASRTNRVVFSVYDTAAREGLRIEASGTAPMIGFLGAAAIARITTAVAGAAFVAGAGTAVNDASTFGGYTMKQIAQALINYGLLT